MNKKLLAAAIAAAFIAPIAATADTENVTVYGKVHASVEKNDFTGQDNYTVSSNSSRLGFKGSEDLGNGLKAIWQYELDYDVTDGGGVTGDNRNSFIGLSGGWGTLLVGRHDTPAKVAFYAAGNEVIGDSVVDLNRSMGFEEVRASNAIAYISPSFSGLTVAGAAVAGEQNGSPGTPNDGLADAWSVGALYGGYGIKAGLGYTDHLDVTVPWEKWNAGASYSMGPFSFGAQYQFQEEDVTGKETNIWALQGQYAFGNNTVGLMYGETETDQGSPESDTWNLSLNHMFSKRTSAYAAYSNRDVDGGGTTTTVAGDTITDGDVFSVGMIHNF